MKNIVYPRNHFCSILQVEESALLEADKVNNRVENDKPPQFYTTADLSAYRRFIAKEPPPVKQRKQLFLNFKGGTGKTSISVSYAYSLAEKGYKVLLVDLDSQGHAAKCLGFEAEDFEKTLYDVLIKKVHTSEVIIKSPLEQLHLLPSNLRMSTIDLSLMPMHAREFRLIKAFEQLSGKYDYIILDAPPSFGLLNLNALMAANDLFVPVLADFLSFHGLRLLFDTISGLEQDLQLSLDQVYILINNYNPTTRIAREARESLENHYTDYLLSTVIRQCTKLAQASSEGQPITAFDPFCKASEDIEEFVKEIFNRTNALLQKEIVV